jgi:glucose-6-phosphate-specific signal transduction histidine kinase
VKKTSIFPLAKLGPLGILTAIALIGALYILITGQIAKAWIAAGFLPLGIYLGVCHQRARKIILAEVGREREIVEMSFVSMAADRAAQFWNLLFSSVAITTGVIVTAIWGYQGFLSYVEGRWIPLTLFAVLPDIQPTDYALLNRLIYFFGDTNLGVGVLIVGLILAAPLAAIQWRSNNKAKFRRNDLGNLKKRS